MEEPDAKTEKVEREKIAGYCSACKCESVFERHQTRHKLHFVFTVLTGGLWLIPWLAVCIEGALRPWRCDVCGWHKPEFRRSLKKTLAEGESALIRSRRQSAIRILQRDYEASKSSGASLPSMNKAAPNHNSDAPQSAANG